MPVVIGLGFRVQDLGLRVRKPLHQQVARRLAIQMVFSHNDPSAIAKKDPQHILEGCRRCLF